MRIGYRVAERFVLERVAGRGGMGEVYRALDQHTGQPVAVKILRGHKDSQVRRFEREARLLNEIEHPLIARYIDCGTLASGECYLAMEWLDGEDLAARLVRERPGAAESIALALSLAEALGVLHDKGIVHRDLKPSNIFLVDKRLDRIKLLDLGVAQIENTTRITETGALVGTVAYMAPEQARGATRVDARADVFALGCVLFECLTGRPAFSGDHVVAKLTRLLFEESPRLFDHLPGAPAALDALLARMLGKSVDERPRDGWAAARALRAFSGLELQDAGVEVTMELAWPSALTDGEQRAMALILVGAPADDTSIEPVEQAQLERAVAAHGSTVERLIDGSAAVLLSSPHAATDLAARAAHCALAMSRHAAGRQIALAVGFGELAGRLPAGSVIDRVVRLLRSPAPSVHARRAPVVLDETTMQLLDTRFDTREENGVFVLLGERDSADVRTLLGKPTPCVGRQRELGMLEGLVDDCIAGGGSQAALLTAPAGVGKSRVALELLRRIRARTGHVAIWIGRGDPLRAGSALGLLGQALRAACGVRDGEPLEVRREKVGGYVAERIAPGEQMRVTGFIGEIIGTPFPDDDNLPLQTARRDAQLMNDQMRAAFLDLLTAECARNPVVILLEDLHWGDRPTVQFLDRALRDLREQPLFVLALARPEVHEIFPGLWAERVSQEIRLRGLNQKAIEQLTRHVLGAGASADTMDRLVRLSEGNAFYLEELLRWSAGGRGRAFPETVVAMVQSRLAALDPASRRLLRAASVFGESFWPGGIMALSAEDDAAALLHRLAQLTTQELVVKRASSRFLGEDEYVFRHALLHEGAYSLLTDEDRMLGHRLAGEWLEAHGEQDALMLAEQFEKGGDGERAGRHYLRATKQAWLGGDSIAAIAYARRGLACGISDDLRIVLLGLLCEAHWFQSDLMAGVLPQAEELVQMAPRGGAPWVQGMFIVLMCALRAGQIDRFKATLDALLEIEPSLDAVAPLGLAMLIGIIMLDLLGRIAEAHQATARLDAIVGLLGDREPLGACYLHAISGIRAASTRADPARGLFHCEAAIAIADAIGYRRYAVIVDVFANANRWYLGAWAEAEQALKGVAVPDEEMGYASSNRPFILAWLLADRGLLDEARQWAAQLAAAGKSRRLPMDEGRGRWALAEVLRRAGEFEAADAEIQAALATLRRACPLDVPGVLATLAALRVAQGRCDEALAAAEEGLMRLETIGGSSFFRGAFVRLVLAECLHAAGKHDAALAAIVRAKQCILANAEKIENPAHRQRFLEEVPENRRTLELAESFARS